jgi:hypothetical protein
MQAQPSKVGRFESFYCGLAAAMTLGTIAVTTVVPGASDAMALYGLPLMFGCLYLVSRAPAMQVAAVPAGSSTQLR